MVSNFAIGVVLAVTAVAPIATAPGAPLPAPVNAPANVRVFSDVCRNADTGTLQGTRIVLLQTFDGNVALFQHAVAGPFDTPAAARANVNPRTGAVSFAVRTADYEARLAGTVSDARLTGTLSWHMPPEDNVLTLARVRTSERVLACRPKL
jgi:hypothetical protein